MDEPTRAHRVVLVRIELIGENTDAEVLDYLADALPSRDMRATHVVDLYESRHYPRERQKIDYSAPRYDAEGVTEMLASELRHNQLMLRSHFDSVLGIGAEVERRST